MFKEDCPVCDEKLTEDNDNVTCGGCGFSVSKADWRITVAIANVAFAFKAMLDTGNKAVVTLVSSMIKIASKI